LVGDVPKKKLWYLDSSHGKGVGYYCSLIRHYLEAEYNKLNSGLDMKNEFNWAIDGDNWENVPIQTDGYSCGPFVLSFIEAIAEGTPMIHNNVAIREVYRQYVARILLEHWKKRQLNDGNTVRVRNNEQPETEAMRPHADARSSYAGNSDIAGVADYAQCTYGSIMKLAE
jgi:hypothetical protein